jgi:hypothetical protein
MNPKGRRRGLGLFFSMKRRRAACELKGRALLLLGRLSI